MTPIVVYENYSTAQRRREVDNIMARKDFIGYLAGLMVLGTHGVKYVVIVAIYTPFVLISVIFHWEPLSSGKCNVSHEVRRTYMMFWNILLP